ncbi:ubiquitin carboxyl-terminal hydrolase 16-like [Castanea sativa]|uniref:ubiquitin carboxyl-terminal hydrolase 16-like n=1 Tax=Castanea sativa TaxID=21020 RepID=UPI003F64C215
MRSIGYILGFQSLFLVFIAAIGFFIRRKWLLSEARKAEIKRLLVLAAEEAARAELEASAGYGYSYSYSHSPADSVSAAAPAAPISTNYQCAVCYSPTTTRCARCKAIRYCSGKCQIVHWRQGHKDECRPPNVADRDGIDGGGVESEGGQHAKPIKTLPEEPAVYDDSGCSSKSPSEKVGGVKVEFVQDGKGTDSVSEASSDSFSGFSGSTTSGDVSDDASVGESSNESGGSDVDASVDNSLDVLETTSVDNMNQIKKLSPKFASLVDSVGVHNKSSKLDKIKPDRSEGEHQSVSTSSSGLGNSHSQGGSNAENCAVSSDFWGRTLDSIGSTSDSPDNSALSNSNGASKSKLSDSGSALHFSFNFSESTSPLHSQGAEIKGTVSDDALKGASRIPKHVDRTALTENISVHSPKGQNSVSLNNEGSSRTDNGTSSDSHTLKSRGVKSMSSSSSYVHQSPSNPGDSMCTGDANAGNMPSSISARSNLVVNDPVSNSHPLKSREVGSLSSSAFDACLASGAEGHSVPVKYGKVDGVQASASIPSQVTNSSPNSRSGLKSSVQKVVHQFRGSKLSKNYPLRDECEVTKRYSDKGLFPYELFVKLYHCNKVELSPCGLINCGNSCYANAVLQCLAFTPPLHAYFLQGLHSKACVKKEWCFTCELESLVLKAKERSSPLSPIKILSQLQNIGSQLGSGTEEDAHEFLRHAIDTMQSICLKEAGVKASGSLEEETTLMGLTFGGYLRSKIKCTKCQGKSERHERMMDLTVEIEGDIGTLEEALKQFTATETLDGENKYQCSRCKSYERAKKKLTIMEAPNVLTIALKRFQSGKFGKLNKPIQFPEILDLAPFCSGTSDKSPIYRLYGVVVHLDIMNASFSGHYVCYVKNSQNKWFKIDDSSVTAVELERVLTKGAYLLLYARCSPRAPRLIRNRILSSDAKIKVIPSWFNGKNTSIPRSLSTHPSVVPNFPGSNPRDGSTSFVSFYTRYRQLQRILEEDSSSDNSSLLSHNSDEGSCSTDSTRDSASADDFPDCIFGDSGHGWNSPLRNPSDSDTCSSSSSSYSSPSCSKHSPNSYLERNASGFPETSGSQTDCANSTMEGNGFRDRPLSGSSRLVDLGGQKGVTFLHSDSARHCRKLVNSSSCRDTDSERLGLNAFHDVKTGISFRKSASERRD